MTKLCNDNGLDLKELTPNECDGPLYKLNNIRKKLDLNLLLAGFPKSLSKFVTLWGALRLNKEYKTVNDFFEKLTEIHPDWIKDAAFLLGMDEEIVISKEGKDLLIGFNPKFLIDALRVIDDEEVTLYLMNPKAPCFIKDDNESYIYLILPVNFNAGV